MWVLAMKQSIVYISLLSLINFGSVLGITLAAKPAPASISPSPTITADLNSSPTIKPSPSKTKIDTRCLITVDNHSYDVTSFRRQHSGGDIFACGTDMSSTFHKEHNSGYLSTLAKYEI